MDFFSIINFVYFIIYFKFNFIIKLIYTIILFNNFINNLFISTISQIGDIIISYFKRKSKIKDTGKIITWSWWFIR